MKSNGFAENLLMVFGLHFAENLLMVWGLHVDLLRTCASFEQLRPEIAFEPGGGFFDAVRVRRFHR